MNQLNKAWTGKNVEGRLAGPTAVITGGPYGAGGVPYIHQGLGAVATVDIQKDAGRT